MPSGQRKMLINNYNNNIIISNENLPLYRLAKNALHSILHYQSVIQWARTCCYNDHGAVLLTWRLFLLNLATFRLPVVTFFSGQKQLAANLARFPCVIWNFLVFWRPTWGQGVYCLSQFLLSVGNGCCHEQCHVPKWSKMVIAFGAAVATLVQHLSRTQWDVNVKVHQFVTLK